MSKQESFFKSKLVPAKEGSGNLFDEEIVSNDGPVKCLGLEFENDGARRAHFTEKLRKKLQDPEFRQIEGFPIGEDEDILKLSDPPYYTACPNPWIADFIEEWEREKPQMNANEREWGKDDSRPLASISGSNSYHREPFAADVSEGKNDPIYNAHSYHTKVPHKAIMRYILHYTEPGDIVFDGFCGTGMTGVAAQMCGDRDVVVSLGYQVKPDGTILQEETDEDGKKVWKPISKLGARKAVLNDLSPAATFIAYNYNTPVDIKAFEQEAKRILAEVEDECGWMYETLHVEPASSRLLESINFEPCDPFKATKSLYRKDNLPHIQVPYATYFITFRTNNHRKLSEKARDIALRAICHWDTKRWKIFSAVVMPDHVHIIAKPLAKERYEHDVEESRLEADSTWDLKDIMHSIKSFSANEINKIENRAGEAVWQTESYDRIVRDARELANELAYLNHNPVKAGLVEKAENYVWRYVAGELEKAGWKPAPLGKINYTVWSDVFICPECAEEVVFGDVAVDKNSGKVLDSFPCPHCQVELTKRNMDRSWTSKYDSLIRETIRFAKQVPVLINYTANGKKFEKRLTPEGHALISKIEQSEVPYWHPTERMMEGGETRRNDPIGITHTHHFYTKRSLWVLGALLYKTSLVPNHVVRSFCRFLFQQWAVGLSKLNRYSPTHFSQNNRNLSGTLYVGSRISEVSPDYAFNEKLKRLVKAFSNTKRQLFAISTQDAGHIEIKKETVDYVFIDPLFGANLNYSELNCLWENWMKLPTDNTNEAIENNVQGKGSSEYRQLMTKCFAKVYHVLKPGRWMTVEFSNTKASVWNSIQTALTETGFIIANVSALDKKQGSFKAVTTPTAVKQDLVISAYKPNGGFEERFKQKAQTEEGVWDFIRTHLKYLPVTKKQGYDLVSIPERDPRILYDQVIAYYVRKGYKVPIDSQEFQAGLPSVAFERDGMYFLPEQVAEYDRKKMIGGGRPLQQSLFISDEATAIEWLRSLLRDKPQSFQDINPQFMQEIGGWNKNEVGLELSTLLEQNFLCYVVPASSRPELVPSQIHGHLSTWYKELRNLAKDDPALIAKANGRWYVPDPNKAGDLEKLREKALLKEFEQYVSRLEAGSTKKLKIFRLEAVRAGFKKAWQERDYGVIINVAEKIPNNVLEEDPKLLMWYDQAVTRSGE